jgi:hypothetical protein
MGSILGLTLLIVAALLPIVLLSLYSLRLTSLSVHRMVQDNNKSTARFAARLVEHELRTSLRVGETLANLPSMIDAVARHDEERVRDELEAVVASSPLVGRAFVTDPAGVLWSDYPRVPETVGTSFAEHDWYRGVSSEWTPHISEAFRPDANLQRTVVAMAVPIRTGDHLIGVLVYHYHLDGINELLQGVALGNTGHSFVLDHRGAVAAHPYLDLRSRVFNEYARIPVPAS